MTDTPSSGEVEGKLWSLIRNVLTQGHAQQMDYAAGQYPGGYEEFCAHFEEAARNRVPEFLAALRAAQQAPQAEPVDHSAEFIYAVLKDPVLRAASASPHVRECFRRLWDKAREVYANPQAAEQGERRPFVYALHDHKGEVVDFRYHENEVEQWAYEVTPLYTRPQATIGRPNEAGETSK